MSEGPRVGLNEQFVPSKILLHASLRTSVIKGEVVQLTIEYKQG